jgi:glycosyltransferase involved in cell wall biosynthesis
MTSGVLLVGNFLSASTGAWTVGEELALRLGATGGAVTTTSRKRAPVARLLDMVRTVVTKRHEYAVGHIDVYSGRAFLGAEVVCAILRLLGKPYVLTLHGGNLPQFGVRWPRRMRRLLRSATVVTIPSGYLLEQMRVYRADLQLVPNAVDLGAYTFRIRERPRPRLLWLRAFHRIYNPALAPAVASKLASQFPDLDLTMIGPDSGDRSLEMTRETAIALHVDGRLHLPGPVSKADVPGWMDRADVFLSTTNIDNAPVSLVEAMASGLCVVATAVGGIPYLVEHEREALLVPPDDPDAMAAAVHRILSEPGLAARLSRNARAKAQEFDWKMILPQWKALLAKSSAGRTE